MQAWWHTDDPYHSCSCAVLYVEWDSHHGLLYLHDFFSSRIWSNLETRAITPLLSLFLSRTENIKSLWRCWKGRCWETCLPWLVWEGITWVGALGCWASSSERSFPECRMQAKAPGFRQIIGLCSKAMCPMYKICVDPASLFKTQKKKKDIFFSILLSWVPENCSLDRCSSASFDCFPSTPKSTLFISHLFLWLYGQPSWEMKL